jgi:glutathione peroxidase
MSIYQFQAKTLDGKEVSLSQYQGKALLIVNVASRCGFTPQYEGLEALYKKHHAEGFEILGFPCNQFGAQEPGNEAEIRQFCDLNFGVTFPLFSKVDVNGANAHPLYKYLTSEKPGILGTEAIKWNFTKFLIGKDGEPIKRYASAVTPAGLEADVEAALKK